MRVRGCRTRNHWPPVGSGDSRHETKDPNRTRLTQVLQGWGDGAAWEQIRDCLGGVVMRYRGPQSILWVAQRKVLRHRFSPKPTNVATPNSLPKKIRVAKEAVSAASQAKTHHQGVRRGKPNDAPTTKPRPCVKTMLGDHYAWLAEVKTSCPLRSRAEGRVT